MAYSEIYNINFDNLNGVLFRAIILQEDYSGGSTSLKGSGNPVIVRYVNDSEDYYPSVLASELTLEFVSTDNFVLGDIITDDELQYRIDLYHIDNSSGSEILKLLWSGFLNTADCAEQLTSDPRIIVIKATDGIGLLKGIAFQNSDDEDVYSKETLLQIIEWCLFRTNLELNLKTFINVFESAMNDRDDDAAADPLSQCKVHTRSWLEKNVYSDCYTVLTDILSAFKATIFQANGKWVIVRFHDFWATTERRGTEYTYPYTSATPVAVDEDHIVTIDQIDYSAINADHIRSYITQAKCGIETFNYKVPDSIPRNKTFDGDFISLLSSSTNAANTIDFWAYEKGSVSSPTTCTATPYRNIVYDSFGNVSEIYIVLPRDVPALNEDERLASEYIEVAQFDRVTISFDHRLSVDESGAGNLFCAQIILFGDSGQKYTLDDQDLDADDNAAWFATLTSSTGKVIQRSYGSGDDLSEWMNFNVTSQRLPEDGLITIWLYESSPSITTNESWFRNVEFGVQLFINESLNVIGEKAQYCQNKSFRQSNSTTMMVADSPKKIIAGALFLTSDGTILTSLWHRQGIAEERRLIQLNALANFQVRKRLKQKVEGSFMGLLYDDPADSGTFVLTSPISRYDLQGLAGKKWLLISIDISLTNDSAFINMLEHDETGDSGEGDTNSFTYLFE